MFAELLIRDDVLQVFVFTLIGSPLPCKQESKLLKSDWVFALGHKFANKFNVVHLLSDTHGIWVPLELSVNVKCRSECVLHLFSVRSVVRTAE